jgi:hypothetical protein
LSGNFLFEIYWARFNKKESAEDPEPHGCLRQFSTVEHRWVMDYGELVQSSLILALAITPDDEFIFTGHANGVL